MIPAMSLDNEHDDKNQREWRISYMHNLDEKVNMNSYNRARAHAHAHKQFKHIHTYKHKQTTT